MPVNPRSTGRDQKPAPCVIRQAGQHQQRAATGQQRHGNSERSRARGKSVGESKRTIRGKPWQRDIGRRNSGNDSAKQSGGGNLGSSPQGPKRLKERPRQQETRIGAGCGPNCGNFANMPTRYCASSVTCCAGYRNDSVTAIFNGSGLIDQLRVQSDGLN